MKLNMLQKRISILKEEYWWGGATSDGIHTPYGSKSFSRNLNFLDENQGVALLISSKGRYVWSSAPFTFSIDNGVLLIEYVQENEVFFGEGFSDLKCVHTEVSKRFFPPTGKTPDKLAFLSPQYNTWIEMFYKPSQQKVLDYADAIIAHGMPPGVLIIDDNWMNDYGDWEFNCERFPDAKKMIDYLHTIGFKVMLWICPYISPDSAIFRTLEKNGMLLKTTDGSPAIRRWWNGYSAILDYTKQSAIDWFLSKLSYLSDKYGVDGFKFDAGDPAIYGSDEWNKPFAWENYPYTNFDCEAYSKLGYSYELSEYRACWNSGGTHLIQRQKDKRPVWEGNGLDSLIPSGLLQGLIGYPFNCPDMIGGGMEGEFNSSDFKVDVELFIRFLQCSLLFPIIQFSIAPWRVLDEVHFSYCRDMLDIRQKLAPYIYVLAVNAAKTGEPIIRSMEYEFPHQGLSNINDQFMLGSKYLVAPMLKKGVASRDIYFPEGKWIGDDGSTVYGPKLQTIDVPLSRLPYYYLSKEV